MVDGDAVSVGEAPPEPDAEAPLEGAAEGFPDIELFKDATSLSGECVDMINGLTGLSLLSWCVMVWLFGSW